MIDESRPFRGAAGYYDRFRPLYPQALIDDLCTWAGVTGQGRLLDLACGTGELGLRLSPSFRDVWAVDAEPEMVEVGRAKAAGMGIGNVRWTVGRAEDLIAQPGSFELITIGNAFHRMDRPLVAARMLDWLIAGGAVAIVNTGSVWEGSEAWQAVAVEVIRRWTGGSGRSASANTDEPRQPYAACLADAGFGNVEEHRFEAGQEWNLDSFIGYLYSTSIVAAIVRAGSAAAFEADLRAALLALDPTGQFRETLQFSTILARR